MIAYIHQSHRQDMWFCRLEPAATTTQHHTSIYWLYVSARSKQHNSMSQVCSQRQKCN